MAINTPAKIQAAFSAAIASAWKLALEQLAERGIEVGSWVRNENGDLFEIATIKPTIFNFGDAPTAAVSCYGVKYRADGTWGTHKHWVGDVAELIIE